MRHERPRPTVSGGRAIVVGEMCPQGAGGRPAVAPFAMRTTTWSDATTELTNIVERGSVPRFTVFAVDGKPAGVFQTVGATDVGLEQAVAAGAYIGAAPCTREISPGQRVEEPRCVPATGGCGLAVGVVTNAEEPENVEFQTGGACLSGEALAVDIDGDGVMEQFALAGILDGVRSPTQEWNAAPVVGVKCTPAFELFDVRLGPADPKQVVKLDLLGVVDLDGDGRRELVIALTFPTVRTIVIYTASGSPQRLELAGEGMSFPR